MNLERKLDKYIGPVLTCFVISLFFWKKLFKHLDKTKTKSILVIKLSGLGDYALLWPTLRDLKQHIRPNKMSLLTLSGSNFEFINSELFDEMIHLKKDKALREWWNILLRIRRERFDLIVDFTFTPYFTAILTFFSGARFSIGYKTMGLRKMLYNCTLPVLAKRHTADAYYEAVRFLSNEPNRTLTITPIKVPYHVEFVKTFFNVNSISDNDVIIGIHPCSLAAGTYRKNGLSERYALLAERLRGQFDAKIIFTGTEKEGEYIERILGRVKSKGIIFCFNCSLAELVSVMAHYRLFIGIDSGPMHIASLMEIPTIGIFGPDTPERYAPLGSQSRFIYHRIKCSPCIVSYKARWKLCSHVRCMEVISIDDVVEQARLSLLEASSGPFARIPPISEVADLRHQDYREKGE